jgi:hypothetical protein
MWLMRTKGFRHLPVLDHERLVGLISIRDVNEWLTEEAAVIHATGSWQGRARGVQARRLFALGAAVPSISFRHRLPRRPIPAAAAHHAHS